MSVYVLVHGSWHGAWCWYKIVPQLEKAGHKVLAPDLASLGRDKTPLSEISLDTWSDSICRILDEQSEPAIVVGHSRGGIVISEVAEKRPDKIRTLVYLAAFLLPDGKSLLETVEEDGTSEVPPNLVMAPGQNVSTIRTEAVRELFYGECPDADVALARLLLSPEAMAPSATPLRLTEKSFGRVPRVYIECLRDRAIPPHLQKKMYSTLQCRKVLSLDTDHSPFFSCPEQLTRYLLTL